MKHTDFFALTTDIKTQERQELILAVKAYGGHYKWGEDEEKPIIAVNVGGIDPNPDDVVVLEVSIVDDGLVIIGVDKTYCNPVNFESDDVFAGHLSFIIDYIPPVNGVEDVAISAKNRGEENPWRCEECGSTDVEYNENGMGGRDDWWCNHCEEHTYQVRENELMITIQDWFHGYLQPDDNEVISSLDPTDFPSEEAYLDACTGHWNSLTNEQKISIWKSLTSDKTKKVYSCSECGNTDILLLAWVDPNDGNKFVNEADDQENGLCSECGDCVALTVETVESQDDLLRCEESGALEMEIKPTCPRCEKPTVEFDTINTIYYCNSCGCDWNDDYVLVAHPDDSTYFEQKETGYPSFNSEDNGARYVTEYEYIRQFGKKPNPDRYYKPVMWPESQCHLEKADTLCELINDEKGLADFGPSAMWVPIRML